MRKVILLLLTCQLTACSITPKPITVEDRYNEAKNDLSHFLNQQEEICGTLNFNQALARGLKYNLDYRIKLVNNALQAGQLDIAMFTMYPALNASGSIYNRSNTYASSGITSTGQPTDVLNSTPNTIRSARVALSWNALDFGLGYVRAKQQGDRMYIAEEESRKQLQKLSQDILVAYWSAYSAQQLMVEARNFEALLTRAKNKLARAMRDKAVPKESILNFQAALLEGNRRIIQLQYKYEKAMLDLRHLLNLSPNIRFRLAPPPQILTSPHDIRDIDFSKMDAITLVSRPELSGQEYQQRIAQLGVKTVILQALPGITLNEGWNYNSNKYLANQVWLDKSLDVAWNLLNLASLPASIKTARAQVEYEKLKLMALTFTVLTETRYAYSHYISLLNEYDVAHKQTLNAQALYKLNKDRELASLASNQQVVLAELKALTAKMDEDLLQSDLSTALGELYLSVGSDVLPADIGNCPLDEVTEIINRNFIQQNTWNFKNYVNNTYQKLFGNQQPFTLQLFGAYDLAQVKKLQKSLKVSDKTNFAHTKNKGRDWYVLTAGKYTSAKEAEANIPQLPNELRKLSPWARTTDALSWIG